MLQSNSVSQAFINAGSLSVTSTFLPIEVMEGGLFYQRIIRRLYEYLTGKGILYKNWLEFMAYNTRSNIALEVLYKSVQKKDLSDSEQEERALRVSKVMEKLGKFSTRTEGFQELIDGIEFEKGKSIKLENVRCESLLYSHIGRSDLIYFERWINAKSEHND